MVEHNNPTWLRGKAAPHPLIRPAQQKIDKRPLNATTNPTTSDLVMTLLNKKNSLCWASCDFRTLHCGSILSNEIWTTYEKWIHPGPFYAEWTQLIYWAMLWFAPVKWSNVSKNPTHAHTLKGTCYKQHAAYLIPPAHAHNPIKQVVPQNTL